MIHLKFLRHGAPNAFLWLLLRPVVVVLPAVVAVSIAVAVAVAVTVAVAVAVTVAVTVAVVFSLSLSLSLCHTLAFSTYDNKYSKKSACYEHGGSISDDNGETPYNANDSSLPYAKYSKTSHTIFNK